MTPTGPKLAGLAGRWGGRLPDDRANAGSGDPPATQRRWVVLLKLKNRHASRMHTRGSLQCLAVARAVGGPSRATVGGGVYAFVPLGPAWRVVAIGWTRWSDGRGECKGRRPLVRRARESMGASAR
ncbi:uncharacterized protein SCHCODRAFT_02608299 [Schizophyllum commune H4-8]|uniref:Expressed protein n=1 Tax=Schizophyllum commune (strain H4-8 / FGSC 9210) TaxID=578458 RepID=D8PUW9_SCHCM|nr:uncharacterized protein SCHCODRAFT_02608299 [Schizophyllum commune H4-8]KAI5900589.1 hypothetical protein SCHCODRAFT_02608299 [Schizophyllum commune H4-8]